MSGVSNLGTCDWCQKAFTPTDRSVGKTMNGSTLHQNCYIAWADIAQRTQSDPLAPNPLRADKIKMLEANVDGLTETVDALKTIIRIQNGQPVDQKDSKGNTALIVVAKLGLRDEVALLISKGANVNEHDNLGDSPLFIATTHRHSEIALVLIQAGANPYEYHNPFSTVVIATRKRMYDVVEASIQANPKVPDFFKDYLLKSAQLDSMLRPILLKFKLIGNL